MAALVGTAPEVAESHRLNEFKHDGWSCHHSIRVLNLRSCAMHWRAPSHDKTQPEVRELCIMGLAGTADTFLRQPMCLHRRFVPAPFHHEN
jgi:hypothetical protein